MPRLDRGIQGFSFAVPGRYLWAPRTSRGATASGVDRSMALNFGIRVCIEFDTGVALVRVTALASTTTGELWQTCVKRHCLQIKVFYFQ